MTQGSRRLNKQLVDKALEEIFTPGLEPLIRRKMEIRYGSNWLQDAPLGLEDYYFDGNDLRWNDPAAVINLLIDQWDAVFKERNKLDNRERSWVHEIRNTRNDVKHNSDVFDYDYSFRALDSMERFLSAADAKKAAQEVKQLKEQLQKSPPVGVRPEFQALIQEKTEGFVGRGFVFKAIQDFLTSQTKGYFIIEADPGVGKSAILAEYVRRTKCVFHFNIRSQAINRAEQFLQEVCSQIISRYSLPYPLDLAPDATRDGKFLGKLLEEASAIVYFLAELREPVSRRLLAELSGEKAVRVQQVINEWQQFLREVQVDAETRYSIYHQSFSDFLYRKDIVQAYGDDFS